MANKKNVGGKPKGGDGVKREGKREYTETLEVTEVAKNPIRALMLRDILLQDIVDGLRTEQVAKEEMDEVLFLTATNAILEMVWTNLPEELVPIFKENMDDYLSIAMINKENGVDLLALFRDQFLESQGDSFEDERELMRALTAFEDQWWGTPKDFLKNESPNALMEEARKKMDSVLKDDETSDCGDIGEDVHWASRAYVIRDLWFPGLRESMSKESMPTPQKRERLFMSVANALLDLVVNVMPDFMSEDMFEGLDHSLELALVKKESKVDVMQMFEDALAKFEDEWWNTPLNELGGKTPSQAMQAMGRKYGL